MTNAARVRAMMDAALARATPVEKDPMQCRRSPPRPEDLWRRIERQGAYSLLARALVWFDVETLEECTPGQLAVLSAMLYDRTPSVWLDLIPNPEDARASICIDE